MACCGPLTWTPVDADSQSAGWNGTVGTAHVSATAAGPSFTINGPIRGLRYRAPDFGGPGSQDGDGAVVTNINTTETGAAIRPNAAGWAPAVPVFPAAAVAGPFVNTFSGITVTVNADGRLTQQSGAAWRLAKQNANPPGSPDFEWITYEFSSPVTNVLVGWGSFNGSVASQGANTAEGVSQLQVLVEGPCECCPLGNIQSRCYAVEELQALFDTATVLHNPAGHSIVNLPLSIDEVVFQATLIGFAGPVAAGQHPNPGTAFQYTFPTPQNDISRLQWHNGGGSILTDQDGFGDVTFDFYDPANNLIRTVTHDFTAPLGQNAFPRSVQIHPRVSNVARIVTRDMKKQNRNQAGTGCPLLREFQAFRSPIRVAFAQYCGGQVTWFDAETGDLVSPDNFFEDVTQTIFDTAGSEDNDGWIETGAPVGIPQPPNRTLPAPILLTNADLPGTTYTPSNGAIGNWVIQKTVHSDMAGSGRLVIPSGLQINADDLITAIRVNGVSAPFAYGAVIPASTAAVTWLEGDNIVEIEVSNTVAGTTALQGYLLAVTPSPVSC